MIVGTFAWALDFESHKASDVPKRKAASRAAKNIRPPADEVGATDTEPIRDILPPAILKDSDVVSKQPDFL